MLLGRLNAGERNAVDQLMPAELQAACAEAGQALDYREHDGYDHGYFFVSTFIGEHLRFHADALA